MSRVVVLAALLLVLGANEVLACSCVQPTVEEAVRRADAVFLGTIKTLTFAENPSSRVVVEFEVSRVWKGRDQQLGTGDPAFHRSQTSRLFDTCISFAWPVLT